MAELPLNSEEKGPFEGSDGQGAAAILRGLTFQLVLTVLVVTAAVLGVSGWLRYRQEAIEMRTAMEREVAVSSGILAASLSVPIYNYDLTAVESICRAVMLRPEVVSISIEDVKLVDLAFHKREDGTVEAMTGSRVPPVDMMRSEEILYGGLRLGHVRLGISTRSLDEALHKTLTNMLWQAIFLELLLGLPLIVLLHYRFVVPVQRVKSLTVGILQGDLDQRAPHGGQDELGDLTRAIVAMRNSIKGKMDALQAEVEERKRAEKALSRSEEDLRTTLDSIGDAVVSVDLEGRVSRMNPVAERLTGWPIAEAVGRDLSEVVQVLGARDETPADLLGLGMLTGSVTGSAEPAILVDRGGRRYRIAQSGAPILSGGGETTGRVLVLSDITERHALAEQLRQREKLDAIGELAGGIAHDFNNQLTAVLGYAGMLVSRLGDPMHKRFADHILEAANRAADLTHQLLTFAHRGSFRRLPVDTHQVIAGVVDMLAHSIDKRIEIRTKLEADPSTVLADATQLQTAVLNLGLNARDAMPDGGELSFATRVVTVEDTSANRASPAGRYLEILVKDSGVGMSAETRNKVFEPFFTTKPVGKGTGLGLSSVYGTAKAHGGFLEVESELGKGSAFRLLLPVLDAVVAEVPVEEARMCAGQGRILVVDDEPVVLGLTRDMLLCLGYDVEAFLDPTEALDYYRREWKNTDVVLVDMVMPKLNGRDLYLAMREVNPKVRAIATSGYIMNGGAEGILGLGALFFLQKPFNEATLSQVVADALRHES
jgi:PAS domain S-box-containing protein